MRTDFLATTRMNLVCYVSVVIRMLRHSEVLRYTRLDNLIGIHQPLTKLYVYTRYSTSFPSAAFLVWTRPQDVAQLSCRSAHDSAYSFRPTSCSRCRRSRCLIVRAAVSATCDRRKQSWDDCQIRDWMETPAKQQDGHENTANTMSSWWSGVLATRWMSDRRTAFRRICHANLTQPDPLRQLNTTTHPTLVDSTPPYPKSLPNPS